MAFTLKNKRSYIDAWTSGQDVKLTYRTKDGKRHMEVISDYGAEGWYFYITRLDYENLGSEVISAFENCEMQIMRYPVRFEIEDAKWVRVYVNNSNINERYSSRTDDRIKVKRLLEKEGVKIYEGDLKPHKRYCLDEFVKIANNYKVLYYDIETDDRKPGVVVGRDRILTIAGVNQDGESFFFHNEDEEELLLEFFNFIQWDYDILVGYNSENFDKPYIEKRLLEYFREREESYFKYRVIHIDLMQVFIKRFAGDSDITSWSLEFISQYFLGHGKLQGGPKFGNGVGYQYYQDNFEKFKEYNILDARNLYDLNKTLSIIDQIILECQICGSFPSKFSISEMLDNYILRSVRGKGIHFNSIEYAENQVRCPKCNHIYQSDIPIEEVTGEVQCMRCGSKFEPNTEEDIVGAHVFEPVTELHDDVFVFDYKCWLPGSMIYTSNGYTPIEDVKTGDVVQVMGEKFDNVVQTYSHSHYGDILEIKIDNGKTLKVTPDHRFPILGSGDGYSDVLASTLAVGDCLIMPNYHLWFQVKRNTSEIRKSIILSIDVKKYDGPVYSIGVKNQKNPYYVCNGIISHNSLYPSIIRTWNIGPDTFLEEADHANVDKHDTWNQYIKSANNQFFADPNKNPSAIKSAVERLLNLRKQYKTKMNTYKPGTIDYKAFNAKQNAVKMLCNSIYGLMGYKYGRFYRKEIAEAITLGGQWLNKETKKWLENRALSVVYGDTDSAFVKGIVREDIDDLLIELHEFYDDALNDYFGVEKHFIELEYEKHFSRLLLLKKKNYTGHIVELDGKPVDKFIVKGLECIKRDTIPLGKKWQRELIESIIKEDKPVNWYVNWIQQKMNSFFNNEFDIEDITIRKKLTKHPNRYKVVAPHASIAAQMMAREMECYVGMQIPYIVIAESPIQAVHPDWYVGNASVPYYWDQKIYGILKRVLIVAFPKFDWDQYTTKIANKRDKKIKQFMLWFNDPKKKRDKLLVKLNEDKVLSPQDKRDIKEKIGMRVFKVKKFPVPIR